MHPALVKSNIALITGAGLGGIGYSVAKILLERSLKVILVDNSSHSLSASSQALLAAGIAQDQFETKVVDVSRSEEMFKLEKEVRAKYGQVDFLMLNAGVQVPSKDYKEGGDLESWDKIMKVNFGGVLNGTQAFVANMVKQNTAAAIVITGSKQGITQPPGNPAYNVSKSAVKSLSESLSHSLRSTPISVSLLVPGYTWTKLTDSGEGKAEDSKKPAAAWTGDQVAEYLFKEIEKDEFYIICPDNDVTPALDSARMAWSAGDIVQKRGALSRWNPEYETEFKAFIADRLSKSGNL